jgi:general secretion pathway protein A
VPAATAVESLHESAEPLGEVMARLIGLWDPTIVVAAGQNVCDALSQRKLWCYTGSGPWSELEAINRPAILTLNFADGETQYVLLRSLDHDTAVLQTANGALHMPVSQLDSYWNGQYLVLWHSEPAPAKIGPGSRGASVVWVRERLAQAVGKPVTLPLPASFDSSLGEAVKQFQASHGLKVDGIAGTRTLMALAELQRSPGTPTLGAGG